VNFFFSVPVFFRENELIYVQFLHNFYKIIVFQTDPRGLHLHMAGKTGIPVSGDKLEF
jgi:hypothetical protein